MAARPASNRPLPDGPPSFGYTLRLRAELYDTEGELLMPVTCKTTLLVLIASAAGPAWAQVVWSGRVWLPRFDGSDQMYACTAVPVFGTPAGAGKQSMASRTWETDPSGWYRMTGITGRYTILQAGPAHFMRPVVLTNQFLSPGAVVDRKTSPPADYAVMWEGTWDRKAAHAYYQTFVARSKSVTHIGFRIVHDGLDGEGPEAQNLLASVHRVTDEDPHAWPQVGPAVPILNVNGGGALNLQWAAGWNSGEVPLEPGKQYALHLRPEIPRGRFQCFWREDTYKPGDCYRVGTDGRGYAGHDLWLYIAGDGDGLLIPYNKRVQRQHHALTKWGPTWSQTYVAQGRGLAGVMLYAAVATSQPPLRLQRAMVRVRRGGPEGEIVGMEKLAIGQPSFGMESGFIGVAVAPGEVPLEPGETYAVEFEGFGPGSGFNPYMKQPLDPYKAGTSWFNGQKMDYDLDMIIVEYENDASSWSDAVEQRNLLTNGDMEGGMMKSEVSGAGGPDGWQRFALDAGTAHAYVAETEAGHDRIARVLGGSVSGRTVDGGYVQKVGALNRVETYRLSGQVRSSWLADDKHQAMIGWDPTGQTQDAEAATVEWAILPDAHDVWQDWTSPPIRPNAEAISIWLRGRATATADQPFQADFNNFKLQQVRTSPPGP
jgi:hypothetical protein